MNRSELRGRVKELLNMGVVDPSVDEGVPTNARINGALTEARNMLYSRLSSEMPRRFGTSSTFTYPANTESVALSSLASTAVGRAIFKVTCVPSGGTNPWTMDPAIIEEFRNYSLTGTPLVYAVVAGKFFLRPQPSQAMTVTLWHTPAVSTLADGTSPDEIDALFHHVVAYGAAIRLAAPMGDPVDELERMYDNDVRTILMHYETLGRDNHVHEIEHSESRYG